MSAAGQVPFVLGQLCSVAGEFLSRFVSGRQSALKPEGPDVHIPVQIFLLILYVPFTVAYFEECTW